MPRLNRAPRSRILVVDNSMFFRDVLAETLRTQVKALAIDSVKSRQEACQLLQEHKGHYLAVISGLMLEDAAECEMLAIALEEQVPAIALTSSLDAETRQKVMDKDVIDYFFKDQDGLQDVVSLVTRLLRNEQHKILVVDDSPTYCTYLKVLLQRQHYQVISAFTGEEAVDMLSRSNDISLVLLDYQLPGMSGYDVIRRIRKQFTSAQLPVIGVSGQMDQQIPAQILKCGANDFMYKGFTVEEFYSRINNMMDLLISVRELQDAAYKDFLTGLHNRQYFYPHANTLIKQSDEEHISMGLAMMDIDHFKNVNDTYGHNAGDEALKVVADQLKEHIRSEDLLARLGGEEFCVIFSDMTPDQMRQRLETIRQSIENTDIPLSEQNISVTISMGLCIRQSEDLETLMENADQALYQAKASGRNQLVQH
ncbi:GGDEF domain-containing response regulator [Oceanospirillum sediminis]|uniref:diguanylate cyclase n=1 Tax=Oceanospirillum sediminis TaxID=2760088 RepID=A0A839INT0_9GAMM|nr:diguanylate cyclase [Oceanospirillum sediminis]MBB1486551.1 diguanylate cyclase [Oceanospirillum sediminis]